MYNRSKTVIGALAMAGTVVALGAAGAAAASPSTTPTAGTVHVWVTEGKGAVDPIILTGAIGDHGTATSEDKDGKVDANGVYVKIKLQYGTFMVNAVKFNQLLNKLQPTIDTTSCSAWGTGSGPVTLYDGTGSYVGISGTITMTTSFAAVFPLFTTGSKKGQCNTSNNAQPVASYNGNLTGSGAVSF
jgi:hypothetical protein